MIEFKKLTFVLHPVVVAEGSKTLVQRPVAMSPLQTQVQIPVLDAHTHLDYTILLLPMTDPVKT